MSRARRLGAIVVCVLAFGAGLAAQEQRRAVVRGTVFDRSGAVVPGVTVTLRPTEAGTATEAVTNALGAYEFDRLPPGPYTIEAVLSGFGTETASVVAVAGEVRTVDLTIRVAPLAETITVTRTHEEQAAVPTAVVVVQGEDIQGFTRRVSPSEALAGIPGVFAENRRNFSLSGGVQLALRSPLPRFGLRGIQLIQDGIPLTMADGTTEPTNLDLGSAGRVQVLRGPSSVLYGNSAGGVVSIETELPGSGPLTVEPDVQFGSHGYRHQQVKVHGSTGNVSYLVNVSNLSTDGFREHSAARARRLNAVVRTAVSANTEIRGVFNLYDLPFGESPATLTLADARNNPTSVRPQAFTQGWGEKSRQGQGGVTVEHRFGNGHTFRGTGWSLWRDVFNPIPFAVVELGRRAAGFRTEYEGTGVVASLPVTWTTGVDLSSQGDDRLESENDGVPPAGGLTRPGDTVIDQREEVLSIGPFAQARVAVGPRWTLTAGARYDHYDFSADDRLLADGDQSGGRTLRAVSPMAGFTFQASDSISLYGNYATAYMTPTTVELSNTPTGVGGFNEELEPEYLRTFEVGVRAAIDHLGLRFDVGTYTSDLENALVQFTRPDEATFFRNAGEASRDGIEATVRWTPTARLTARLAYTYQHFEFTKFVAPEGDFSGKREPGVPPHQLFAGVTYDAPSGLFTAAELRSVGAFPVNSANTISNWAYQVVNVRFGLRREWNGVEFRPGLGIDNLFGRRYNGSTITNSTGDRHFEPAPGREIYVSLSLATKLF